MSSPKVEFGSDEHLASLPFEDHLNVVRVWAKCADRANGADHETTLIHLRWAAKHLVRLHALLGDPR